MKRFSPFILLHHPRCAEHETGPDHPESPARAGAILRRLQDGPLAAAMTLMEAAPVPREWLEACHDPEYLMRFEESVLSGQTAIDHPDNQICPASYDAAMLAAGAGVMGVDLLEKDASMPVFCNIRPPGHHAERGCALGFCFINNAAVAARYWRRRHGRRVLVIDWDAHHGNGIQAAFEREAGVFYVSLHEHPTFSFPGTGYAEDLGLAEGKGATLNIPLPPGAGDDEFIEALTGTVAPAVEEFAPTAMVVAAGFDGHEADDMSGLCYSTALYGKLGVYLASWADRFCRGRILTVLEGGYHIDALAAGAEAYIAGLCLRPLLS